MGTQKTHPKEMFLLIIQDIYKIVEYETNNNPTLKNIAYLAFDCLQDILVMR